MMFHLYKIMTNQEKLVKIMAKIKNQPIDTLENLNEYDRLFNKYTKLSKKLRNLK